MHEYKWAPERLHTPFFEQVGTREFSTEFRVHHRLDTIHLHTSETGRRIDWTGAQLCAVSIEHEHNFNHLNQVPKRLSLQRAGTRKENPY